MKTGFFFLIFLLATPSWGASASASIASNFTTAREASNDIEQMARVLQQRKDPRSLFPHIYALTILSATRKLERGGFRNPRWVQSLIVNYANLYRRTIYRELNGERVQLPIAWQEEFNYIEENLTNGHWRPEQDTINAINVHIARDLVEALFVTPTDFSSASVRADYFLITTALNETMPQIWSTFMSYTQPSPIPARFEKSLVLKWIAGLRATAWENAKNASRFSSSDKKMILDLLDRQTARRSRNHGILLLLLPQPRPIRYK